VDATEEPPQVVPIGKAIAGSQMNRRGFLGAGITAAAALALLDSCDPDEVKPALNCTGTFAHEKAVTILAVSPDGQWLASTNTEKAIQIWNMTDDSQSRSITRSDNVYALAISGGLLAIGCADQTITLWNFPSAAFNTCLIDIVCSTDLANGSTYTIRNASGQTVTYTQACGTPLPSGAKCVCDCVPVYG